MPVASYQSKLRGRSQGCRGSLRLTYKFRGRRFRLTDVHGKLVKDILA